MKENYTHKSKYFYGNEISEYGLKHGYIDFRTLAKCGDMVLCNNITNLFYNTIGNDYIEPQQVNGYIDNEEEIEELKEKIDDLLYMLDSEELLDIVKEETQNQIDQLQEEIDQLQEEQEQQQEIFQYYIIDDRLAQILQDFTNEIVYYVPILDVYVWGITHYGTSWDYVLTDIAIDLGDNEE